MSGRNEKAQGYKKTPSGWLPNHWQCLRLSSIIKGLIAGVSVNSYGIPAKNSQLGILKTSAVTLGNFRPEENKLIKEKEAARTNISPLKGRIIISRMNTKNLVGANAIVHQDCPNLRLPDRLWQMEVKDKKAFSSRWLGYIMSSSHIRSIISSRATGTSGSMKNVSKNDILTIYIPTPSTYEQKKIAEILSAWDRAIEQMSKLVEAKQRLKKGLMQQLLTGRMRFPEFGEPAQEKGELPEGWDSKPLGSFGSFSKGKGISNSEKIEAGLPCITYGEIYTRHDVVIKDFLSFIDRDTAQQSKQIKTNDILFAGSGETLDEIGKCVAFTKDTEAYAGGDIIIISPEGANSIYLSYLLNSDLIIRHKRKLGQGHSVVHIYSGGLKTLHIPKPTLSEQNSIAAVLSICDSEIESLKNKLSALREQKKGLMQKLLTGVVRVKVKERTA